MAIAKDLDDEKETSNASNKLKAKRCIDCGSVIPTDEITCPICGAYPC